MDEFWVCQNCRSLNRAGSGRCYSCRHRFGAKPPEVKAAAVAAPPTAAASRAGFGPESAPGPYFSRPVALASPAAPVPGAVGASPGFHVPNPVSSVRRRIALSLAMRQFVSVDLLGYVTAALLGLVVLAYVAWILAIMPAASYFIQHASLTKTWSALSVGQQGTLELTSIALAVTGFLALLCFSVFVGLSTHNATGLGADQPMLIPYRAGTCWAGVLRAQALIFLGLVVPAALIWKSWTIPGLIAALVAVELAHRRIEDPGGWMTRPASHLPDLYIKLGVQGSMASPLASVWSISFRLANLTASVVSALPLLALTIFVALVVAGRDEVVWQSTGLGPGQIVVVLLVAGLAVLTLLSLALLIPITVGLVQRQKVRKTLVRAGRSRSWVAKPGERGYVAPATAPARYDPNEDDDRIVERRPTFAAGPLGDPGWNNTAQDGPEPGGPPVGGPGFGGPAQSGPGFGALGIGRPPVGGPGIGGPESGGPGFGGAVPGRPVPGAPDQASLNSPSTTSSFPWSDDSPEEPG